MKQTVIGVMVALVLIPNISFAQTNSDLQQQLTLIIEQLKLLQERVAALEKLETVVEKLHPVPVIDDTEPVEVESVDEFLEFKCHTNWRFISVRKVREECKSI